MREWVPTPLSQIRNQPKSGYINPKIVSTMNTSIWHHIWTILEFFSIFRLQRTKNWPKKNFQKSHCTLRDTPKRYQWSKFGVFRTFRNPESTFGVILRYCAICAKNQFRSFFLVKIGSKLLFKAWIVVLSKVDIYFPPHSGPKVGSRGH